MTSSDVDSYILCIKLHWMSLSLRVLSQTAVTSLLWEHLLCVSSNLKSGISLKQNLIHTLFQFSCLALLSCWESLNIVSFSPSYPWIHKRYYPKHQENQIKILWPNNDWEHTKGLKRKTGTLDLSLKLCTFMESMSSDYLLSIVNYTTWNSLSWPKAIVHETLEEPNQTEVA